jgi:hypothetical protein
MPEKINVSDFLEDKTVEFVEKVITTFCSRKGLTYIPLAPDFNLLFAISIERCNLEYPGKNKDTHFQSGIRSYLEAHDKHLILLLKPDNKENKTVRDVILDLTAIQELQKSGLEGHSSWLIEDAIITAIQLDEKGLEKFRRPKFS